MSQSSWVAITSIHPAGEATKAISKLCVERGWSAIVVGDKKTPLGWSCPGMHYLSLSDQHDYFGKLSQRLPTNHYARKNLAYLYAMERGAEVIIDLDDDIVPTPSFPKEFQSTTAGKLVSHPSGWINIYRHFTDSRTIWPRGLPLWRIPTKGTVASTEKMERCYVQQYLSDGDPDVDAIYRMLRPTGFEFKPNQLPVVLSQSTWSPFNSQNTVFLQPAFSLLYLPSSVNFRLTDIWRSFVAQAAMQRAKMSLSFHGPTTVQKRNPHSLYKDFLQEIPGYRHNHQIQNLLQRVVENTQSDVPFADLLITLWRSLRDSGFVSEAELEIFSLWMERIPPTASVPIT
jgi:hypothetical protein